MKVLKRYNHIYYVTIKYTNKPNKNVQVIQILKKFFQSHTVVKTEQQDLKCSNENCL